MKRPNIKSPIAIVAGLINVFIIEYVLSWLLANIELQKSLGQSEHLLTKEGFHFFQGIFIILGGMIGAFVTSILSPKREIFRTIILGIIIIIIVMIGAIRSRTQSLFDMTHLIIYIFIIPSMWLIAYLIKRKWSAI